MNTPPLPTRRRNARFALAWRSGQNGFSMLELALALLVVAILMGSAFGSRALLDQQRQLQFVNHVRGLEASLLAFRLSVGRWPGDCNGDGLLDYRLQGVETADALDFAVATSFTPAADADATYATGTICPASSLDPYEEPNVAYNELKRDGQALGGKPNRLSADHQLGGTTLLGHFESVSNEERFNAILLTGVPTGSARRLASALDGFDGSAADGHRVRRLGDDLFLEPQWSAAGESESQSINVIVFFDRLPPRNQPAPSP